MVFVHQKRPRRRSRTQGDGRGGRWADGRAGGWRLVRHLRRRANLGRFVCLADHPPGRRPRLRVVRRLLPVESMMLCSSETFPGSAVAESIDPPLLPLFSWPFSLISLTCSHRLYSCTSIRCEGGHRGKSRVASANVCQVRVSEICGPAANCREMREATRGCRYLLKAGRGGHAMTPDAGLMDGIHTNSSDCVIYRG